MSLTLPQIFPDGPSGPASPKIMLGVARLEAMDTYAALSQIKIVTSRKGAASGTIEFSCYRDEFGRWPIIDNGYFAPWREIRLEVDFEAYSQHLMSGYVLQLTPEFPENRGEAKLTLELQDESALLDREQKEKTWPGEGGQSITDQTVIAAIAAGYPRPIRLASDAATGQTSTTLSQAKTDYAFILERADASAFEMRISDGVMYFGPPRLSGTPQPTILVYAGPDSNAVSFKAEDSGTTPNIASVAQTDAASGSAQDNRLEPDLPLLADSAPERGTGVPEYALRVQPQGEASSESLTALAQGQINEASLSIKAECEIDGTLYGHVLQPGETVEVDGVGTRYGGKWYVDMVEHTIDAGGYMQKATLLRNAVSNAVI